MEQIPASEFASKFSSKMEIERFLRYDCKAFLPSHKHLTIYFFKDLVSGLKRVSIQKNS